MGDIIKSLREAEFPIVVLASAGTGKTYSLVNKVKHCVETGINPLNILIFTFTVDAANELKKRVPDGELMTIGTIHSVMYQIIREHSKKRYFVMEGGAQNRLVSEICKELKIDYDHINNYLGVVGLAKNTFTNYYDLLENSPELLGQFFGEAKILSFAMEYEKKKEHNHKIDFDDMTLKAFEILSQSPAILDNRQERWKYIFVDEAQDLCPPQIDIINLLGAKYQNLFVVGDPKQAIYASFRASTSEFINNFTSQYKKATQFYLPTTYRCSQTVTDAGNKIAKIIDRSVINTANKAVGNIYEKLHFYDQHDEADYICDIAIPAFNSGKSVKILYRTNSQSLIYQLRMLENNMPYSINQTNSIFQTKEARLAIACCEFVHEYKNMTFENKCACIHGIRLALSNKWAVYSITKRMKEINKDPMTDMDEFDDEKMYRIVNEMHQLKEMLSRSKSISEIFNLVSKLIDSSNHAFSDNAPDNLIGIAEFARDCKTIKDLESIIAMISKPRLLAPDERAISLSTIHGAKGLEADIVFLTGVCDDLLPHKRGLPEEELNLFYVGVTRAREDLHITGFLNYGKNEYPKHSYAKLIH